MAWEKAKQTFRIQGRRRAAASSVASLGYRPHTERARQELNPLVPELFISTSLNDPPGWVATGSAWKTRRSSRRCFAKLKRPSTLLEEDRVSQPLSPFQLLTDIDYVDLPATEDRDPDWRPSGTSSFHGDPAVSPLCSLDASGETCCLIGVISQLFPGRDRVVRAAQILTSKGEVTRLVAKAGGVGASQRSQWGRRFLIAGEDC
ncbi:hypothetical protein T12_4030 [Trichinella patagoniensis]|uniref:DUF5641 domain-containing protein n=1 Tax=Trichinella patagoniensis TaxID=990121 RepID=A0A0V0Z5Y7_9BILA|nr:hypothetical protein T12_4030 [Trichinella patagoniensis]